MLRYLLVLLLLAPQGGGGPYDFVFDEVRDGVWMAYRPDPFRLPVSGNVTVIVNDADVVVVDAGSSPQAGRRIIDGIRRLTDLPVSVLVNTHGHEDHVLGNQAFVAAYPDVEIVARPGTRDYLSGGPVMDRVRQFPRNLSRLQEAGDEEARRVARRGLNGDPRVAEHLRRYYHQDIYGQRTEYLDARVVPPTRVFEARLALEREGRTIELLDLGFGKAGSDVVVYLPRERLVIAGDLVTHPIPLGFARLQTEWLQSLRRLLELDFDDVIPGHGEAPVDRQYVRMIVELVEFELDAVRASIAAGRDADAAAWDITFREWAERFVGHDPIGLYYFNEWFVKPSVARAHAELSRRD